MKKKAEDVKFLSEINATQYKNITANNGQAFVNELKDQVDLKAQIIEMEDLTIETIDWVNDSGNIYFDYENENFTTQQNNSLNLFQMIKTKTKPLQMTVFQFWQLTQLMLEFIKLDFPQTKFQALILY